ncbi:MAG TPA: cob(I)yrinic acid a,c-diamide adenosyltransferase [Nitrososphaerales archaeon]|nr:cob(I)yrinic acid a,c-diamide adenosyltransferase [Nitrososphaerales archaeon]
MKLYTKTGDKGETGLFGGKRVRKDNARVEAYGAVDETNSIIGVARSYIHEGSSGSREALSYIDSVLEVVQNKLFAIGAILAGSEDPSYAVKDSDIEFLEKCIDRVDESVQPIRNFIVPFGTDLSARLHFARTVSRRAERRIVALASVESVDPNVIVYANRLSDFLFSLARYANKAQGVPDTLWKKEHHPQIPNEQQQKLVDDKQQQQPQEPHSPTASPNASSESVKSNGSSSSSRGSGGGNHNGGNGESLRK